MTDRHCGSLPDFLDGVPTFDEYRLREDIVDTYYQQEEELDKILLEIRNREATSRLPRFCIGGPTGCGKTLLARAVAAELGVPFITIQCKYSMNEADLLGSPELVDGETVWQLGPLSRAIIASREDSAVLLLDEVNRARPESKGVLFSALDDRCMVQLEARDSVPIRGNATDLIVFSTINEGREYFTEELDLAERRRLGNKISLDYLGRKDVEAEAELLSERTPVSEALAPYVVNAANDVRQLAEDRDSSVRKGIPTSMLLDWMSTAAAYAQGDIKNPVMAAAYKAVINPFYGAHDEEKARTEVIQVLRNHVDDAPVGQNNSNSWAGDNNGTNKDGEVDIPETIDSETLREAGVGDSAVTRLTNEDNEVDTTVFKNRFDLSDSMVAKIARGEAQVVSARTRDSRKQ